MNSRATFIYIKQHRLFTRLMQAADVFTPSRVVAHIDEMEIAFKEGETVDMSRAERLLSTMAQGFDGISEDWKLVLLHLVSFQNDNIITINNEIKPYIDKSVREISNGSNWECLDTFIERLGLKAECDDLRYIKEVEFIKTSVA